MLRAVLRLFFATILSLALLACGDDDAPLDAGVDAAAEDGGPDAGRDAGPARCIRDADCEDDVFCNGRERCLPDDLAADDRGCVGADAPACAEGETCDEELGRCLSECDLEGDVDDDGAVSIACGGADCDDMDDTIFPGADEVCADEVDQDCDDRLDEGC